MGKGTRLEDGHLKRIIIARDTLVGHPPGPLPVNEYKANLVKHGCTVPKRRQIYLDLQNAREAMAAVPEVSEVKSWLSHLMMHLTSKAYKKGKFQSAIGGGKLLADLTGALAPPQEVDRSVEIARYLQEGRFFGRDADGESAEGDAGEAGAADAGGSEAPAEGGKII